MSRRTALSECPFTACRSLHPDHLWIWRPNVYVDENDRTWLPIIMEVRPLGGPARQGSGVSAPPPGPGCQGRPRRFRAPGSPWVQRGVEAGLEGRLPGARGSQVKAV